MKYSPPIEAVNTSLIDVSSMSGRQYRHYLLTIVRNDWQQRSLTLPV
ncbi:MAG: hypothetical protein VZR73_18870 [Acutalibacteraceae bacterium]|nr:hypothetical protein [Acutalibacteraceae bacterium]